MEYDDFFVSIDLDKWPGDLHSYVVIAQIQIEILPKSACFSLFTVQTKQTPERSNILCWCLISG